MSNIPTNGSINFNINFPNDENGGTTGSVNDTPTNSSNPQQDGMPDKNNPTEAKDNTKTAAAVHVALGLGKQAVNTVTSNIGIASGNYTLQSNINNLNNFIDTGVSIGLASAKKSTLIATVGAIVISTGANIYKNSLEREKHDREAERYSKLYGFASNGGR
jgi:hypothetical protein